MSEEQEKRELIKQMGSQDNEIALAAVERLRDRGWLMDGSLRYANLRDANLNGADLNHADLLGAKLSDADLILANLHDAILVDANLFEAKLSGAKLNNTYLIDASLHGAKLTDADLHHASLRGADLSGADLRNAKLVSVDLSQADLRDVNLSDVNLGNANLNGADISDANLAGANLSNTNLTDANLTDANLSSANLNAADFATAICHSTIFADVDLSDTKGLEEIIHLGPSRIDIDTLYKSKGNIPEVFLRGCGVHDDLITFLPSLIGKAIEFYSCFISYSSQDQEFTDQLAERMRSNKLRVWYAPEDMKGGEKIHEQIETAIKYHDKLVLVLSEDSMNSPWVQTEIRNAVTRERKEKRRVLFPIMLCPYEELQDWKLWDSDLVLDLAKEIREYFIPDFSNWKDYDSFSEAFERLLADLRKSEEKSEG